MIAINVLSMTSSGKKASREEVQHPVKVDPAVASLASVVSLVAEVVLITPLLRAQEDLAVARVGSHLQILKRFSSMFNHLIVSDKKQLTISPEHSSVVAWEVSE